MVLVVGAVKVLAIPARLEESLSADTSARKLGDLRRVTFASAVEADVRYGLVLKVGLIVYPNTVSC